VPFLKQQVVGQQNYILSAPNCMLLIALSVIRYITIWNFYFKLLPPGVLEYKEAVDSQSIKTQLYEIIIY